MARTLEVRVSKRVLDAEEKAREVVDQRFPPPVFETDVLYRDDNLHRLAMLPAESIDLIYIDPPFFSNRIYEVIWGDEAEVRSFEDRWTGGVQVYVEWMRDRAAELHRVLKPTGSMYLHCDPHASHYLKVMMDSIFGLENFRSEIVWKRSSAHSDTKQGRRVHGHIRDVLLFYTKGNEWAWNPVFTPYDQDYVDAFYKYHEPETGRRFGLFDITGPGHAAKGNPRYTVMGVTRYWRFSKPEMDRLIGVGRVVQLKPRAVPRQKRYLDEMPGVALQDVWTDLKPIGSQAQERLGYPTQKPESLLRRIIDTSSNPGDIVLDAFCGCGTTVVVAQQRGRRYVGIDISPTAVNMTKRRLAKVAAPDPKIYGMPKTIEELALLRPFEFQNWVIDRISGRQANRKTGDMGIDGWTFLLGDPVQVKQSHRLGRNVVDNFETAIRRAGNRRGHIIAFSFGPGAKRERARIHAELDIHFITVQDLLERMDWVWVQMGLAADIPQLQVMPQFDPHRHTPEELIASATG